MRDVGNLKLAVTKAIIVLLPSYSMAYLTEKMVWVVPTLVAAGFFASTIDMKYEQVKRQVEEDTESSDGLKENELEEIDLED